MATQESETSPAHSWPQALHTRQTPSPRLRATHASATLCSPRHLPTTARQPQRHTAHTRMPPHPQQVEWVTTRRASPRTSMRNHRGPTDRAHTRASECVRWRVLLSVRLSVCRPRLAPPSPPLRRLAACQGPRAPLYTSGGPICQRGRHVGTMSTASATPSGRPSSPSSHRRHGQTDGATAHAPARGGARHAHRGCSASTPNARHPHARCRHRQITRARTLPPPAPPQAPHRHGRWGGRTPPQQPCPTSVCVCRVGRALASVSSRSWPQFSTSWLWPMSSRG